MCCVYESRGMKFRYPDGWELNEERRDRKITVTVASPQTSFWSLTLFFDCLSPE